MSRTLVITCACGRERKVAPQHFSRVTRCEECQARKGKERSRQSGRATERHERARRDAQRGYTSLEGPPVDPDAVTEFDNAWFSGFTAGEGCFGLWAGANGRVAPRFAVTLRADDGQILLRLRDAFGGTVSWQSREGSRSRPSAYWSVTHRVELQRLVAYFDRYPLRAKKAQDYAIWREAVAIYCREGGRAPALSVLRDALSEGREYVEPEVARLRLAS